ncbi:MAG: sigma 54-interacting transcriptional regulator [Clostridiales bacterium]|nr:sigma 54-interacting transcriptional regulator [Clostridiales bacterium]
MSSKKLLENNEIMISVWNEYIENSHLMKEKMRGIISESWILSKEKNVDPFAQTIYEELSKEKMKEFCKNFKDILKISKPFMDAIYNTVGEDGMVVRLTNSDGYVIECFGDENEMDEESRHFFYKGKNIKEEFIGTNAIGLALRKQMPVQVLGAEHYRKKYHGLTTSAAPIRGIDGKIIAVLSMSGSYDLVHPHTLGMVMASALAIEREMKLIKTNESLYRANIHHEAVMKSIREGIVTIDPNGIITDVNYFTGEFLKRSQKELIGKHIETVIAGDNLKNIFLDDGSSEEFEMQFKRKSGSKKNVIVNAIPILNEKGKLDEYLITFRESKKVYSQANKIFGSKAIYHFDDIIGDSNEIEESKRIANLVANSEATVLLHGESGTGKELFAQSIHNASRRTENSFVFINCGAIPRDLVASELFGYEEGAFTGARKGGNPGKFELADGGTLFLDEIGDMPLDTQANLLRVLETKEVVRVGGHEVMPVNVRVIAATHKDLKEEVRRGNFREDLYYRLNVMPIHTPSLRERKEDIRELINQFYKQFSTQKSNKILIDENFYKVMTEYHWPGNVRELQNVMQMVCNLVKEGDKLSNEHLPQYMKEQLNVENSEEVHIVKPLYLLEKEALIKALKISEYNLVQAAKLLEIGRSTLYRKIEKYKIEIR